MRWTVFRNYEAMSDEELEDLALPLHIPGGASSGRYDRNSVIERLRARDNAKLAVATFWVALLAAVFSLITILR